MARPQDRKKEYYKLRAQQTVSEMVVESLARQAEALSEGTGRSFEDAFAEVLRTPAGRRLGELADGPHRRQKAAQWQADLLADREARRPAHLRALGSERVRGFRLGPYTEWAECAAERDEDNAFLHGRFASLKG
jgi:hypothetical protein